MILGGERVEISNLGYFDVSTLLYRSLRESAGEIRAEFRAFLVDPDAPAFSLPDVILDEAEARSEHFSFYRVRRPVKMLGRELPFKRLVIEVFHFPSELINIDSGELMLPEYIYIHCPSPKRDDSRAFRNSLMSTLPSGFI